MTAHVDPAIEAGAEANPADVAEQAQPVGEVPPDPAAVVATPPVEASEADVWEQAHELAADEDERA